MRTAVSAPPAALFLAASLAACTAGAPPAEPEPEVVVRVDTLVVTREVEPPLPEGRPASLCLASGQAVDIRITAAGDTLLGPRRVSLAELGPGVGFAGAYAAHQAWYLDDQDLTFQRRRFSRFGQPLVRSCGTMRIVGDHEGVNLFADLSASAPFDTLFVPVRPGIFQPYRAHVGRVRG